MRAILRGVDITPQWSPVMKTGNTRHLVDHRYQPGASMEPGHEDREYLMIQAALTN